MTDSDNTCATCDRPSHGSLIGRQCRACYVSKPLPQAGGALIRSRAVGSVDERLWAKSMVMPNGCIHWLGYLNPAGYGRMRIKGRETLAHRASYEVFVGPVPEGMDLDHTCHNRDINCPGASACVHRRCINPEHLEPVTRGENQIRSRHTKTGRVECSKGHARTPENLLDRSDGRRVCKLCEMERRKNLAAQASAIPKRQFCRNGHPWTEENVYVQGKLFQCRPCRAARMRATRAKAREQLSPPTA